MENKREFSPPLGPLELVLFVVYNTCTNGGA